MSRSSHPRRFLGLRLERGLWLTLFLAPALVLMLVFTTLPAINALVYSLFKWQAFKRGAFAGLENFQRLFAYPFDQQFLRALSHNTLAFVVLLVVQTGLGLLLAYALWKHPPGLRFFRVTVFLPVILSLVIVGFLWQLFLNPLFGPLNKLLHGVGLQALALPWLGDPATALPALLLVNVWRWVGFPALVFLAGINAISEEYLEAAKLDGASEGQVFRHIILPLLAPSFTIIVLLTFIGSFEWFDLPYVMEGVNGTPAGATDTLALMFYRLAFGTVDAGISDVGLGAAVSTVLFFLVLLGAVLGALYLRRREVEG